jgi:hypothetical protein
LLEAVTAAELAGTTFVGKMTTIFPSVAIVLGALKSSLAVLVAAVF